MESEMETSMVLKGLCRDESPPPEYGVLLDYSGSQADNEPPCP